MAKNFKQKFVGLCLVLMLLVCSGCLRTKNIMYLKHSKVEDFLTAGTTDKQDSTQKDNKQDKKEEPTIKEISPFPNYILPIRRKIKKKQLKTVPSGSSILGGFCTDKEVKAFIAKIEEQTPICHKNLTTMTRKTNLYGTLFWSFLGATVVTGGGMFAGLAIEDKNVRTGVMLGFGGTSLLLALVNGLGGFDGRQDKVKRNSQRMDNMMWTMRSRVIATICNAESKDIALKKAKKLHVKTTQMCKLEDIDSGTYK